MRSFLSHAIVGFVTAAIVLVSCRFVYRTKNSSSPTAPSNGSIQSMNHHSNNEMHCYVPKTFDFATVSGLTKSQLEQHEKLYQGYVKKRNEIAQALQTIDKKEVAASYAPLRSLKVAETFSFNGALLHELYFDNLGGTDREIGPQTQELLINTFGSIENFKQDLLAVAGCARGWVMTGFCILDGTITNFLLDAHNETVPVLVLPLLVIDTYEHAYMIDFGINRAAYLKVMWENINWPVVEARIKKWINGGNNY